MQCMTADLPTLSDLLRLILNLIRIGTVAKIDYKGQRARIQVGKNTTDWRPWATLRAGGAQTWWPPTLGEKVIMFSPEGDFNQAIILPAVYSDKAAPPSTNPAHHTTRYADGAIVQYDSDAHTLTAILPGGGTATVKADKVTADALETICTGNLTVAKNLTVNGVSMLNAGVNATPGPDGGPAMSVTGKIHATDDITSGNISLIGHAHDGIKRGQERSDGPV